ncbi:hypothetical protein WJX81_000290 [Elliptochloris bilobata]
MPVAASVLAALQAMASAGGGAAVAGGWGGAQEGGSHRRAWSANAIGGCAPLQHWHSAPYGAEGYHFDVEAARMKAELDGGAAGAGGGEGDLGGGHMDGGDALMQGMTGLRAEVAGHGKAEYECDVLAQAPFLASYPTLAQEYYAVQNGGAHAMCSEDTGMPDALPDIGQSLFDEEDCLLSVDLPLGALARSMDGSPLSGGDDVPGDMPPELMQQLFGDAGGMGLLPNPNIALSPASCSGPAGRGAHLGTAASAPVMLHATSGRAAAEFAPMGASFRYRGIKPSPNLGFTARAGSAGCGSSQADSAGASGGTRRSQSLTGPSALGGPGASGGNPGGPARMGTSSPDTPSGGGERNVGGGDRNNGGGVGSGRAAGARARMAPERGAGGWGDTDRNDSPLQRSTSSNSLQNLEVAHLAYLTPPHKRKGKGGRQPAADPRLDPNIDPKRARRILANRLSAARSKMKQKSHVDGLRRKAEELQEHCCGLIATYNRLLVERNQLMRSAGFQLDISLPKAMEPPQLDFGDEAAPASGDEAGSGDDK